MSALPDQASHEDLIEKARAGDREAFGRLVEKYYRTVFSIGYARLGDWELAEELAQEVFLRATLHLSALRERHYFGPWLIRIARNVAEDWSRQGQSRARVVTWIPLEALPAEPPDERRPSASESRLVEEEQKLVREAVLRLTPDLREVVLLHFTEGLSKSDIARRLELHPSSVARQLDRALLQLRSDLGPALGRTAQTLQIPPRTAARTTVSLLALLALSEATRQSAAAATVTAAELAAASAVQSKKAQAAGAAAGLLAKVSAWLATGGAAMKAATAAVALVAVLAVVAGGTRMAEKLSLFSFDELRFPLTPETTLLTEIPRPPSSKPPVVYLAPTASVRPADRGAAEAFQTLYRFHLRGAPPSGLPLNVLSIGRMEGPYRRDDGNWKLEGHTRNDYLRDALSFGSDWFAATEIEDGGATFSLGLTLVDLRTSRTASSTTTTSEREFPRLLGEAVRTSARFFGLTDREIAQAEMTEGLPSPETWSRWCREGKRGEAAWKRALEEDPGCRALYSSAAEEARKLSLINAGLRKWPDDSRLLLSKAYILGSQGQFEIASLFASELLRRYPQGLTFTDRLIENVVRLYPARPAPTRPQTPFRASVDTAGMIARLYPGCFGARWEYAYACNRLATLARGCRFCASSETTVPVALEELAEGYSRRSMEEIDAAWALRPDCPELLHARIAFHADAGHNDYAWQKEGLAELERLDPSNVRGAVAVAESHGLNATEDGLFVPVLAEAARKQAGRPRALSAIASSLGSDLSERYRRNLMTPDEIYHRSNPTSDLYFDCAQKALDGGVQLEKWMAGMLREMIRQRQGEAKVRELEESGKHWALTGSAAKVAHGKLDFETCLRLGRLSQKKATDPEARELTQYYIVRSLWKLKRYDEALKEARDGIAEFPDKQTFHYMFAVVALEKGAPLEEAYLHARRAVDISTTNTGANETYEELRTKLGR